MKIQKTIVSIMNKLKTPFGRTEVAKSLTDHKGKGEPDAETVELLVKCMRITPAQMISGDTAPVDAAFALIEGLVDCLHPAAQQPGRQLLDDLRELFSESKELYSQHARWQYAVIEPRPSQYALKVTERRGKGWLLTPVVSQTFTDNRNVATAAAELFTRCALSPTHLDEAIKDFMSTP